VCVCVIERDHETSTMSTRMVEPLKKRLLVNIYAQLVE
jgi:hypothetical protein